MRSIAADPVNRDIRERKSIESFSALIKPTGANLNFGLRQSCFVNRQFIKRSVEGNWIAGTIILTDAMRLGEGKISSCVVGSGRSFLDAVHIKAEFIRRGIANKSKMVPLVVSKIRRTKNISLTLVPENPHLPVIVDLPIDAQRSIAIVAQDNADAFATVQATAANLWHSNPHFHRMRSVGDGQDIVRSVSKLNILCSVSLEIQAATKESEVRGIKPANVLTIVVAKAIIKAILK